MSNKLKSYYRTLVLIFAVILFFTIWKTIKAPETAFYKSMVILYSSAICIWFLIAVRDLFRWLTAFIEKLLARYNEFMNNLEEETDDDADDPETPRLHHLGNGVYRYGDIFVKSFVVENSRLYRFTENQNDAIEKAIAQYNPLKDKLVFFESVDTTDLSDISDACYAIDILELENSIYN